jgi:hypothetical protein
MSEQPPQNPGPGWVPPGDGAQPPPPPPAAPAPPPPPAGAPQAPQYGAPAGAAQGYPAPPAYGGPPNPYYGGQAGPPPGKGMAITAFVLSLIPLVITQIVAIVLAIIALRRVGRNEARGKGFAIAALVISIVLIVLMVVAGVLIANKDSQLKDHRDKGAGEIYSTDLRVGDCLPKFPSGDLSGTTTITPCSESHGGEVFGVSKVDVGKSSTKQSRSDDSSNACVKAYEDYIGGSPAANRLKVTYFVPQPSTLNDFDKAICVAGTGSQTTGSLKGTGGS